MYNYRRKELTIHTISECIMNRRKLQKQLNPYEFTQVGETQNIEQVEVDNCLHNHIINCSQFSLNKNIWLR